MDNEYLYEDFCTRLEDELADQFKRVQVSKQMSPSDLEITDTLLHALKSIKTIMAMDEKYTDSRNEGASSSDRHYAPRSTYSGRRSSSRESEEIIRYLENKMNSVRTEDEAIAIKNAIDAVSRVK